MLLVYLKVTGVFVYFLIGYLAKLLNLDFFFFWVFGAFSDQRICFSLLTLDSFYFGNITLPVKDEKRCPVKPEVGVTSVRAHCTSPAFSAPVLETFLLLGRILWHWALVIVCELVAFSQTAPQGPKDRHSCPGSQVSLPEKVSSVHRPSIYHVLHVPRGPLGTPERPTGTQHWATSCLGMKFTF